MCPSWSRKFSQKHSPRDQSLSQVTFLDHLWEKLHSSQNNTSSLVCQAKQKPRTSMQHQNEGEAKTSSPPCFPRGAAPHPSRELFLFSKTPETLIKYALHGRVTRSWESGSKTLLPVWKRLAALHIPSGFSMYALHHTSPELHSTGPHMCHRPGILWVC